MGKIQNLLAAVILVVGVATVQGQEPNGAPIQNGTYANAPGCNDCALECAPARGGCLARIVNFLTYRPLRSPCECNTVLFPTHSCTISVYEYFRDRPSACGDVGAHPGSSMCGRVGCRGCSKGATGGCASGSCGR